MRETREEMKDKARPKRIPVYEGNRNKIVVANLDHQNYQYRWVNDTENRIAMFKQGGWEMVDKAGKAVGDGGVDSSNVVGSALSRGMGGGVTAYLMRIPKELWLEDQARKEREDIAPLEAEMRRNAKATADYGRIDINSKSSS